MSRYRVRIVVDKRSGLTEDYTEIEHLVYTSADSNWCEGIMHLYTALKNVAFYWNVVDKRGERQ